MRVSMTLPSMVGGIDRDTILAWCRRIDDGPFHSLAVGERVTFDNTEQWVLLSAAAALTERVRIVPTVVVLPAHPAALIAKQAATLDVLSAGRVTLGVGVGGRDEDYRALGAPDDRRHQRMDDQVALMRRVWAGEPPEPGLGPVGPPPVQRGGPPVLAGSLGSRSIRRAAAWADGIVGFMLSPHPDDAAATVVRIRAAWDAAHRVAPPLCATSFWYGLGDRAPERVRAYAIRYLGVFGEEIAAAMADEVSVVSEPALREALSDLAAAGCDEVFLVPTTADPTELDETAAIVASMELGG
jgi:alkanesulfonate monooxygenase SsuD/methylene tetrahydromethanopterin reductase-like flavin-dependent oxidoreductase (luciferase family)